jgi:glutamate dehydrogenase (NAD(P)+)
MVSALAAMEKLKINPYKSYNGCSGFGNVGSFIALLLERSYYQTISDISGALLQHLVVLISKAIEYRNSNNGTFRWL